jgi:hypothetical protein
VVANIMDEPTAFIFYPENGDSSNFKNSMYFNPDNQSVTDKEYLQVCNITL